MFESLANFWSSLTSFTGVQLFPIGDTAVTLGGIIRVAAVLVFAAVISRALRITLRRIGGHWPPTTRSALYGFGRLIHYAILAVGFTVGLATIGIDFSNLALLLGALGIGVGFGLQDVVANLFAGLLILFERHLRVGDFIELESGVHGEVREIRMRATRLVTNDNIDILIPNSEFIRGRVVNWTLDEADRRIKVPFGVAYGSNKERVRDAVLEAAERVPFTLRGLPGRTPQVWLVDFGDSSLDFQLVVWLTLDGVKRPNAVRAAYLWEIHTALVQAGIEIPFPQRDLHLRSLSREAAEVLQARPRP